VAVDHQGGRLPPSIVCPPPHQPYVLAAGARLQVNGDGWCLRSWALVGVSLAGGFAVAGGGGWVSVMGRWGPPS
jgi:hypothetical protein